MYVFVILTAIILMIKTHSNYLMIKTHSNNQSIVNFLQMLTHLFTLERERERDGCSFCHAVSREI